MYFRLRIAVDVLKALEIFSFPRKYDGDLLLYFCHCMYEWSTHVRLGDVICITISVFSSSCTAVHARLVFACMRERKKNVSALEWS